MVENMLQAKKDFSRFGLALFAVGFISAGFQILLGILWSLLLKDTALAQWEITTWILTIGPMYLVAFPIGYGLMKRIPPEAAAPQKLTFGRFLTLMLICMPVMYGGNFIGNFFSALFSGGTAENTVVDFATSNLLFSFVFTVLLAPFVEEFLFRKQIIDRLGKYGEKTAIFFSAVTFGLFHMNLFQFFYAFGLGLIFAYVYTRTRMLRYPVIMHMIINFMGGVLAPLLLSCLDMELVDQAAMGNATVEELAEILVPLLAINLYAYVMMGSVIAGVVFLILRWKKRIFLGTSRELPYGTDKKIAYWNPGMLLFIVFCLLMIVFALL